MNWFKRKPKPAERLRSNELLGSLLELFPEMAEELPETGQYWKDMDKGDERISTVASPLALTLLNAHGFYCMKRDQARLQGTYGSEQQRNEAMENYYRYDYQADAMKELMFLAVRAELSLWRGSGIALRDGNVVVIPRSDEPPEFLKRLFGG